MADLPVLTAERTSAKTLTVRNGRGAELHIGMAEAEGSFSPGELLQAAVTGCAALSAEAQLAHELGDDFEMTASTEAVTNEADNRIDQLIVDIAADMSELGPQDREKLITRSERVIDRLCTVKRSLNHGVDSTATVRDFD